jgi:hypothetical protein
VENVSLIFEKNKQDTKFFQKSPENPRKIAKKYLALKLDLRSKNKLEALKN